MTLMALKESEQGGSEEASPDGDTVADLLPSLPNNKAGQRRSKLHKFAVRYMNLNSDTNLAFLR